MHNYCTPHIIKENFENFLIHRCKYLLLSQVYCVWQVVWTPTIIFNNLVMKNTMAVFPTFYYESVKRIFSYKCNGSLRRIVRKYVCRSCLKKGTFKTRINVKRPPRHVNLNITSVKIEGILKTRLNISRLRKIILVQGNQPMLLWESSTF